MTYCRSRAAVVGSAVLSLLACARAAADSAVWVLRGKANSIYIAGSVHALPADDANLPATIDRAYADAESIVMELDVDDLDEMQLAGEMMRRGALDPAQSLRKLLRPEDYDTVARQASGYGLPIAALDKLEPWVTALMLTELAMSRAGFYSKLSVEKQLEARARADGKPIAGLETPAQQLDVFDKQSYADQATFLASTSAELPKMAAEMRRLVAAWRTANLDLIEREMRAEFVKTPKLYAALMKQRNANWVRPILALQQQPGDHLVVVGAMHLVGPDGLIRMLEKRGAKFTRLR
jgi:uncharacterized protein YbaP (TraB family)